MWNRRWWRVLVGAGVGLAWIGAGGGVRAAEGEAGRAVPWEWEVATGVLRSVGGNATPLSYTLLPQVISVKPPPAHRWTGRWGAVMIRPRLSLLVEPIVRGPESVYVGVAGAGELTWRPRRGAVEWFFAAGGGVGWMDSRGQEVPGGQGQDFNLNWLMHLGTRHETRGGWRWSAGVYFQHVSNGGMDRVNPGLDALGPMLGVGRRF